MNKRLGTLIAALSLVAVAEVGNATVQPPSPQPGPCFNRQRQCRPLPVPCSPTSTRCVSGRSGTSTR